MGIYSDNYYSWLDQQSKFSRGVEDSAPNGYKHPNGTMCKAKSIESCPFYRIDKSEAEKIDDVSGQPSTASYDKKIKELEDLINDPGISHITELKGVSLDHLKEAYDQFLMDLEEYENQEHETKWHDTQKRRNEMYAKWKEETYSTIDPKTGEKKDTCRGFGVTFHTTLSDDAMTPQQYDAKVTELCALGKVKEWNVGIFQKEGEISIDCPSGPRAIAMMLYWNQNSIFNYSTGFSINNLIYDEKENPGLERKSKRISDD